jgi:hypothetical protein
MEQVGDLLETPTHDVSIRVFRGGGHGTKPNHMISLLERPEKATEIQVMKGGDVKTDAGPTFRGQTIKDLQQNAEFYISLQETGKNILSTSGVRTYSESGLLGLLLLEVNNASWELSAAPRIDDVSVIEAVTQVGLDQGSKVAKELEKVAEAVTGVKSKHYVTEKGSGHTSLQDKLDELSVFFYGDDTSLTTSIEFKSQLLLFTTVLQGKKVAVVDPKGQSEDTYTLMIGPYMVRDPEQEAVRRAFIKKSLTRNELQYIKDVILKGYPLHFLSYMNYGEFFDKVWKPCIENYVLDDFTFQVLPELADAREYLEEVYVRQVAMLKVDLKRYLQRLDDAENTKVETDVNDFDEEKRQEEEEEDDKREQNEVDVEEDAALKKKKADEKREAAVEAVKAADIIVAQAAVAEEDAIAATAAASPAEDPSATAASAIDAELNSDPKYVSEITKLDKEITAEEERLAILKSRRAYAPWQPHAPGAAKPCGDLTRDTSSHPVIQYLRNLDKAVNVMLPSLRTYRVSQDIVKRSGLFDLDTYFKEQNLGTILDTSEYSHVQPPLIELHSLYLELMKLLGTQVGVELDITDRGKTFEYRKLIHSKICTIYAMMYAPKLVGGRKKKTRRLLKLSHRVHAKHNKKSRQNKKS